MTCMIAKDKQFAFEFIRIVDMIGTGDKDMLHLRFNRKRGSANTFCIYRNFPVSKNFQSEFLRTAVKDLAALFTQADIRWKKQHPHSISAVSRKMYAKLYALIEEKFMGYLNHYAGPVARIAFTSAGTAVFHIFENG